MEISNHVGQVQATYPEVKMPQSATVTELPLDIKAVDQMAEQAVQQAAQQQAAQQQVAQKPVVSEMKMEQIQEAVARSVEIASGSELQINYSEKLGRSFARVIDSETKEVVVEIPPDRLIRIYEQLKDMQEKLGQSQLAESQGQKYGQVGMLLNTVS